ncbi:MAG: hypothetical protein ABIQ11_05135, partial [Saprospiraceae bacterium]
CLGAITVVSSTITGGSGNYIYQWQQSLNGTTGWANVPSNGNGPTYTVPTTDPQRFFYRLVLIDLANGCVDPTSSATPVTVQSEPVLTVSADNTIVCINGSVILTASVTGGSGSFTYQWQISPGAGNWNNVSGGNGSTYNVPTNIAGTFLYRVILIDISNGCNDPAPENITAVVEAQPTVSITATNLNLCTGGSSTLNSTVLNGSGFFQYQWQSSPNNSTWSNITLQGNGASYSVPTASPHSTYYRVLVTDAANGCIDPASNSLFIEVESSPSVTISINTNVVCVGGSALITSTVLNGTNFTYQWQSSPNGNSPWTNITINGNGATYSPLTSLAGTTYYRVQITDSGNGCSDPASDEVELIVQPQSSVTISVNNPQICIGGSSTISSVVNNGSGIFDYQWQTSPNGVSGWGNVSNNGNNNTYDVPTSVSGTFYYRALVTDLASGCNDPASNVVSVIIANDLSVSTQPSNVIECLGGAEQMTVIISGGSGTITYQWQFSPEGNDPWTNATGTGSTSATFTPPSSALGSTYYRVLINATNSGCGQAVSGTAFAIIHPDLLITTQPTSIAECIGGTGTMTVVVTGGTGTVSYQWESSTNGTNWSLATGPGATTNTYTPSSTVAGTTFYRVTISTPGNGCASVTSNSVTAVISQDITVTTQPSNITECVGGTLTMTVAISGGSGTIT